MTGSFSLLNQEGKARRGCLETAHGKVQTPVFMNVATQAAIKGAVSTGEMPDLKAQVILLSF